MFDRFKNRFFFRKTKFSVFSFANSKHGVNIRNAVLNSNCLRFRTSPNHQYFLCKLLNFAFRFDDDLDEDDWLWRTEVGTEDDSTDTVGALIIIYI